MNKAVASGGTREGGYTLVGVLVALVIIGAAIMVLLSALSTAGRGVGIMNRRVTAENLACAQMEVIKGANYRANPTVQPYPTIALPSSYTMTIEVSYWVSPTFQSDVPAPADDEGLQRLEIAVYSEMQPGAPLFVLQGYKGER